MDKFINLVRLPLGGGRQARSRRLGAVGVEGING